MSQPATWGVPTSGPATPSQMASAMEDSLNAGLSLHSGTARPAYAVAGTPWLKTGASPQALSIYDGSQDILVGWLDTTSHLFTPVWRSLEAEINLNAAATTDLGSVASPRIAVLGNTQINSFGSGKNLVRIVRFAGSPLVKYSSAIPFPGGADVQMSPGAILFLASDSSANWMVVGIQTADGSPLALSSAVLSKGLDNISNVVGTILYRGVSGWVGLSGGVSGQTIVFDASGKPTIGNAGNRPADFWTRDEKPSGTIAGASSSSAFVTRTQNVVKRNVISGASLGSNQFTLPVGTYYSKWRAPGTNTLNAVGCASQSRLQNITDGTTIDISATNSSFVNVASTGIPCDTFGTAYFTLTGTKVLELQHWITSGASYGRPSSTGSIEVYAEIEFWKM